MGTTKVNITYTTEIGIIDGFEMVEKKQTLQQKNK